MGLCRPSVLIGPANGGALLNPITLGTTLTMAERRPSWKRQVRTTPLYQREAAHLDCDTAATETRIRLRFGMNRERQGEMERLLPELLSFFGTGKNHLWAVDDDQHEVITTSNDEVIAPSQVVEFTGDTGTWLNDGDFLFYPNPGFDDEIVVVSSLTSSSFTADLTENHTAGKVCYRVACCYPNSTLLSLTPSSAPLGKGSLVAEFLCPERPLYQNTLPT